MNDHAGTVRRFLTGGFSSFPFEQEMRDEALASLDALLAERQQLHDALILLADNAEAYLDLEQDGQRNYPDSLRLCVDEARTALKESP